MKPQFKILPSKDGQFYTELVAGNGEVLTTSEMLTKRDNAGKNIRAQIRAVLQILNEWYSGSDTVTLKTIIERMDQIDASVVPGLKTE